MNGALIVNGMAAGFPIFLLWLKLAAAFSRMAKRKGKSVNLALIGAFPLWALFFGIWLMTRPDKDNPTLRDADMEAGDA